VSEHQPTAPAGPWVCPTCGRAFRRAGQQHSCRRVDLDTHVGPEHPLRPLFDQLLARVRAEVTACDVIALPCCVHLGSGASDFLAVLPRKRHLEVRFTLDHELASPRIQRSSRTAAHRYKHSVHLTETRELDETLLDWVREAYHLAAPQPRPRDDVADVER
jgi:hypothetical protein